MCNEQLVKAVVVECMSKINTLIHVVEKGYEVDRVYFSSVLRNMHHALTDIS